MRPQSSTKAWGGATQSRLGPRHAGVLLLERGLQLRIAVGAECGPVGGGFEPLAVGRAEPELDRHAAFADVRMRLQRKTLVELHLQLGRVRLAFLIARLLGILEL